MPFFLAGCSGNDPTKPDPQKVYVVRIDGNSRARVGQCLPTFSCETGSNQFQQRTITCSWESSSLGDANTLCEYIASGPLQVRRVCTAKLIVTLRNVLGDLVLESANLEQRTLVTGFSLDFPPPPAPSSDPKVRRKRESARNYQLAMSGVDFIRIRVPRSSVPRDRSLVLKVETVGHAWT